jgi:light-regulated signal transduction histidine kinase (bacteriophytochrome)
MITSYLQLIERRYKNKLDADADEFIGYAVDGAARMRTMINDLLEYSRIETRGKTLQPTSTESAIAAALSNLEVAIRENNAIVTHDPLPVVTADATQLTMLFQNLIGNGIKFHDKEAPHVHVSVNKQGGEWVFSVSDNGIGIEPQYFGRLFQVFQRLHTRDEYPGTGIGLALCKRIVERHGGRIWVESEAGRGATFYFTIPVEGHHEQKQ